MQRLDWGLGQAELGGCRALGGEMRYHVSMCMRVCTCVRRVAQMQMRRKTQILLVFPSTMSPSEEMAR